MVNFIHILRIIVDIFACREKTKIRRIIRFRHAVVNEKTLSKISHDGCWGAKPHLGTRRGHSYEQSRRVLE